GDTMEFEFKTPEQILSEEVQKVEPEPPFNTKSEISVSSEPPAYKPKAIPFTSNIPVPAPGPEEFKKSEPVSELLVDYMPETIISKKERKKLEKQKKKEEKERKLQKKKEKAAKLKEEMQKAGKEEKEKAKKEKEKAKLEKEKELQKKREKAAKLKEEMQKVGKKEAIPELGGETQPFMAFHTSPQEKKETFVPFQAAQPEKKEPEVSTLFQTLTQKSEPPEPAQSASFIPFGDKTTTDKQESSTLRIIPNVADFEKDVKQTPSTPHLPEFFDTTPEPIIPKVTDSSKTQSTRKDIIICQYCGAMLSSDYAFCNKCGAKL
ncbi:MAG: zinc ribbon domain-containing protein, partial [Promethearchaeota archaeon]